MRVALHKSMVDPVSACADGERPFCTMIATHTQGAAHGWKLVAVSFEQLVAIAAAEALLPTEDDLTRVPGNEVRSMDPIAVAPKGTSSKRAGAVSKHAIVAVDATTTKQLTKALDTSFRVAGSHSLLYSAVDANDLTVTPLKNYIGVNMAVAPTKPNAQLLEFLASGKTVAPLDADASTDAYRMARTTPTNKAVDEEKLAHFQRLVEAPKRGFSQAYYLTQTWLIQNCRAIDLARQEVDRASGNIVSFTDHRDVSLTVDTLLPRNVVAQRIQRMYERLMGSHINVVCDSAHGSTATATISKATVQIVLATSCGHIDAAPEKAHPQTLYAFLLVVPPSLRSSAKPVLHQLIGVADFENAEAVRQMLHAALCFVWSRMTRRSQGASAARVDTYDLNLVRHDDEALSPLERVEGNKFNPDAVNLRNDLTVGVLSKIEGAFCGGVQTHHGLVDIVKTERERDYLIDCAAIYIEDVNVQGGNERGPLLAHSNVIQNAPLLNTHCRVRYDSPSATHARAQQLYGRVKAVREKGDAACDDLLRKCAVHGHDDVFHVAMNIDAMQKNENMVGLSPSTAAALRAKGFQHLTMQGGAMHAHCTDPWGHASVLLLTCLVTNQHARIVWSVVQTGNLPSVHSHIYHRPKQFAVLASALERDGSMARRFELNFGVLCDPRTQGRRSKFSEGVKTSRTSMVTSQALYTQFKKTLSEAHSFGTLAERAQKAADELNRWILPIEVTNEKPETSTDVEAYCASIRDAQHLATKQAMMRAKRAAEAELDRIREQVRTHGLTVTGASKRARTEE